MPWFRRKNRTEEFKQEAAPAEAAPLEAPREPKPEPPAEVETGSEPAAESRAAPRRRGTRGGRGKKKPAETSAAGQPEAPPKPAAKEPAAAKQPARQRRERQRRGATPKRASLPQVRKEILVSVDVGEQRVAVLEDGKPAEVYLERRGRRSIAGDIFKGIVDNVLPGMEASFVDIGLEKNGFLYVDEIVVPELEGKRHSRRIQDLVQRGQEVLVQAVKDPMGTKGARLTTEISLPGRFLVLVPFGEGIGVSRRLEDDERERLKAICKGLELPEGGIIVRTAAEGASQVELEGDLALLRNLWDAIQAKAAKTKAPAPVYQEAELPLRIVRDLFIRDFERLRVDHAQTHRRIEGYLKRTSPELAARVELYTGAEPLMEASGVDQAVRSTLSRRVDLPSGGYLIFDYAEAFTVIDVNTGRFVGARGKGTGARLEDTITKNNLEAVGEVVRQLRLRDIGGIIVIDFIDMANPKNRQLVEEALQTELQRDRTKTYVVEISPLGLVEMTRQNVTDGPREILTRKCPVCLGDGIVVSHETHAIDDERRLRRLVERSPHEAFLVELNDHVADLLVGPGASRLVAFEEETGKRIWLVPTHGVSLDHLAVLAEGSADEVAPDGLPLAPGQELMVKLEPGDDENATAHVDGCPIAVAGAAGKVGKRMKIQVVRSTPTRAYAVLTSAKRPDTPVLAEDLAEAGADVPKRARKAPVERVAAVAPEDTEAPESTGDVVEAVPTADEEKPKKKSRRGSRGGRGRKKKAVIAEAVDTPADTVVADDAVAELEPPAEEKPKPKTRRGSRGGRGRKKPTVKASANGAGATELVADAVDVVAEPAGPDGVPDAEDGDGAAPARKRTRRGSRGGRGRKRKPAPENGAAPTEVVDEASTPTEPIAAGEDA